MLTTDIRATLREQTTLLGPDDLIFVQVSNVTSNLMPNPPLTWRLPCSMCDVQLCQDVTESAGNAMQASGANAAAIFGGDSPPLSRSDTRVRRIPFPTRCKPLALA